MKSWVDRLVKCGIQEKEAKKIVSFLYRKRRTLELISFVRIAEEATGNR